MPNFFGRPEGMVQQPKAVQLLQPLAFLHVRLASRQRLGMLRIHHLHLQSVALQHFEQGHPIHSGGLHHHRLDATGLQPPCHAM